MWSLPGLKAEISGRGAHSVIKKVLTPTLGLLATVGLLAPFGLSQQISRIDRELAQAMLENVASDVRKYYFDPKLHGVDWDTKVREAKEKIEKATSYHAALLDISALFELLDDSHTFLVPPGDARYQQDYGWQFEMVGTRCYVTKVRPKSDAEAKDLKPGDEVVNIDGVNPTRGGLSKMKYVLDVLLPQPALRVSLRDHSGKLREVDVKSWARQDNIRDVSDYGGRDAWHLRLEREDQQRLMRPQARELGNELMILKIPVFLGTKLAAEGIIDKARQHSTLIVDLRGNPGGAESTLQELLGGVFERDIKIADRVTREKTSPLTAKSMRHNVFTGKLIVLVDSLSGSSAELFARVVQLEKRGIVLGDSTSGSVMEAKHYHHQTGNPGFFYWTSVSNADLVMADGKSLEHTGVTPDETILPSAEDLANNRDVVMARAAEIAGVTLTPEAAAKLFPYEWPVK
jgi:C-terminal processing protease CtpA/Prc